MEWYALRSKPNKEEALWRELGARGHPTFYPRLQVKPANPRARKVRAYFPGYMFVQTNLRQVGSSIFSWLPHSLGLVSFGGEPAEVPEVLIENMRKRLGQGNTASGKGFYDLRKQDSGFKQGDKVVISDGPFARYQAMFDSRLQGTDRVRVLLQLLQSRPISLDLPATQIELANRL